MSEISLQFATGVEQAMDHVGVTATYTRKDTEAELSLTVSLVMPAYQVSDDDSVVMVAANCWDVLMMTSDLAFDATLYEPQSGDTVTVGDRTYTVAIDEARRFCWTWDDDYRVRRRLFAKLTSGA